MFVLHASTHDRWNPDRAIVYDAVLTTGEATSGPGGDSYTILGATGTASDDGLEVFIDGAEGTFTLAGGAVAAIDSTFSLSPFFGGGSIQKGAFNFIAISEVAGPLEVLTITPRVDAAVPEPATWAMMIAGFGLTGAALRRRRTQVALA